MDTDDSYKLRMIRDALLALGDIHVVTLFQMLENYGAANRDDLKALFATPRMKPLARVVRDKLSWL